jgi:hypothetical protein
MVNRGARTRRGPDKIEKVWLTFSLPLFVLVLSLKGAIYTGKDLPPLPD